MSVIEREPLPLSSAIGGARLALFLLCCLTGTAAGAFGAAGHRIAGAVAEQFLCEAAKAEISRLGNGESLADLGLWADRVRSTAAWRYTEPWHYVNIDDGEPLAGHETPAEGDVLWAASRILRAAPRPEDGRRAATARAAVSRALRR
jgi:hypothetical protein